MSFRLVRGSHAKGEPASLFCVRGKRDLALGPYCPPRNVNPPGRTPSPDRRPMADNTEWFEGLATDEAKKERIIIRSWGARAAALAALLFIVAYAMNA